MSNFLETYSRGVCRNYGMAHNVSIGQEGKVVFYPDAYGSDLECDVVYTDLNIDYASNKPAGQRIHMHYDFDSLNEDLPLARKNAFELWKSQIYSFKPGIYPANLSLYFVIGRSDPEDPDYEWGDNSFNCFVRVYDNNNGYFMTQTLASEMNRKAALTEAVGQTYINNGTNTVQTYRNIELTNSPTGDSWYPTPEPITCPFTGHTMDYNNRSINVNGQVFYSKLVNQSWTYKCKIAEDAAGNKYITDEIFTETFTEANPGKIGIAYTGNILNPDESSYDDIWIPALEYNATDQPKLYNASAAAIAKYENMLRLAGGTIAYHTLRIFDWE